MQVFYYILLPFSFGSLIIAIQERFLMDSSDIRASNKIRTALAALADGDDSLVKAYGLAESTINNIRHILNIYANKDTRILREIIASLLGFHAPESGLLRLERFLSAADTRNDFPDSDQFPRIFASLLATSGALSVRLNANQALIGRLAAIDDFFSPHTDRDYYISGMRTLFHDSDVPAEKVRAIHLGHTVHLMRICVRNTDQRIPIHEILAELSALAEAVVALCLRCAAEELFRRTGITDREHNLVVLGLGKLGGRELNVSSDVDLLYLCGDNDALWGNYDTLTFHTMLAENLTRFLTEATAFGSLYRVDTRLRADGASGPLVRTVSDYLRYLELRGEGWERQMLLKARPVAGDFSVADTFFSSVERFVFPSTITRSPNREIVALKNQIEARMVLDGGKKTHIKLMEGGIRDIEFIVQCLQLLMGGIHPEVRATGTMSGLDRLREFKALSDDEHTTLSGAYTFYRRIENALQWRELLPSFSLPGLEEELRELEAFLGLGEGSTIPGETLHREIEEKRRSVRAIYDEIFSAGGFGSIEEMAVYAATAPYGDDRVRRFFESLGFGNPVESARNLTSLVFGSEAGVSATMIHPSAERFLPVLLKTLSALPDPDGALERFLRVAESYRARYMLFDVLGSNAQFFELLISITHASVFITDILINDPSLLDWLFETAEILHSLNKKALRQELRRIDSESRDDRAFTRSCLTATNREKVRIGARDIIGVSATTETFRELTTAAESIVGTAFDRAFRELSAAYPVLRSDYAFAVIAAGRLGAGTMNFGSDLDLIFVYKTGPGTADCIDIPEYSVKLAARILGLITGGGGTYKMYDVDARLRPEGGSAVLAISLDSYQTYLERRASEWERLAHVRSRAVAGSSALGKETMELLHRFVYHGPFSRQEVGRIREIRSIMVDSSLKRYPGLINIKSGPGGIADIDFIAQSHAAHYGRDNQSVRQRETGAILNALSSERIIDRHDGAALLDLYAFLTDVEKAIRVGSGRAINTVPASEIELSRVARLLGFKNIRRFSKRLEDVRALTKEFHERMMTELQDRAGNGRP